MKQKYTWCPGRIGKSETFTHQPLDQSKTSIRLIQIKPGLNSEGLIECEISHTTIDASYVCLSYRWGDPGPFGGRVILMNGQPFVVRWNLFEFLQMSCTQPEAISNTQRRYWIDALCIDQSNIPERNRQVAQMGNIYSSAQLVHIWLGTTLRPESLAYKPISIHVKHTPIGWSPSLNSTLLYVYIFRNPYWSRAWVTQEIILAQSVVVSIGTETLSLSDLRMFSAPLEWYWNYSSFKMYATHKDLSEFHGKDLIFLLDHFNSRDTRCSVVQDRVFSKLSLCHEADIINVDYNMRLVDLGVHILNSSSRPLCICSTSKIAGLLDLGLTYSDENNQIRDSWPPPLLEVGLTGITTQTVHLKHTCQCLQLLLYQVETIIREDPALKSYCELALSCGQSSLSGFHPQFEGIVGIKPSSCRSYAHKHGYSIQVGDEAQDLLVLRVSLPKLHNYYVFSGNLCEGPASWKDWERAYIKWMSVG